MPRTSQKLISLVRDGLFAAILVVSKEMLAFLPNVEIVTVLLMAYTTVYRFRALAPIYVFVVIEAFLYPSVISTLQYAYVWLILWGLVMLLPRAWQRLPVYVAIGTLFGLAFGILTTPVYALYFGLNAAGFWATVVAGFSWDITHAIGNFVTAFLAPVLIRVLRTMDRSKNA